MGKNTKTYVNKHYRISIDILFIFYYNNLSIEVIILYSLFIDTHDALITVALINEEELLIKEKKSINSHSIYLVPMIKEIMEENNVSFKDLKEVLVVNGPGSFTGIRIGLSVAKTVAYALKIDIKTISSLALYLISNESNNNNYAVIKDTKGYYIAFKKDEEIIEEYVNEIDEGINKVSNTLDLKKIYQYLKNKKPENVHLVKANYVKKIEVEK